MKTVYLRLGIGFILHPGYDVAMYRILLNFKVNVKNLH